MAANRAILADIHDNQLDPTIPHFSTGADGRITAPAQEKVEEENLPQDAEQEAPSAAEAADFTEADQSSLPKKKTKNKS